MDVVIVGFGTGAVGAIRAILGADRDTDIVVVDRKGFDTYSPCGMPYVLAGEVEEHKVLKHSFPENGRLKKFSETEVISIDRKKKLVRVRGAGGAEEVIAYSSLILDTGAMPLVPSIPFKPSLLGKGIYTFTRPMDLDRLLEALPDIERAAVVGGGAIGLELAQALHARGKKVVLVEKMAHLLPVAFDTDMAKRVSKALPGGIDIRLSAPLEKIEGTGKVEAIEVGGDRIVVDTVLLSMGVAPETNLAQAIGLETTKMGIVVDEHMRTNDPDIYAVGDCIQSWSRVTGKPMASRLAPPALAQGAVAGLNIAGEETGYPGSLGAFVTVIGGVQFASTGIRACDLEGGGSARITVGAKPDYMGGEEVTIKLVAMEDGKVAGAQVVGPCAAELVNRVAIAITAGFHLSDLVRTEIAYCPPVNDAFDPLVLVAETLIKRFRRKKR